MEKHVLEEAKNVQRNAPVFPGDTLSHVTARELERRGWAKRNGDGDLVPTALCPYRVSAPMIDLDLMEKHVLEKARNRAAQHSRVTVTLNGAFPTRETWTSSAENAGYANAISRAIKFLTSRLPAAIELDHKLHDEGNLPPKADFGKIPSASTMATHGTGSDKHIAGSQRQNCTLCAVLADTSD